MNPTLSQRLPQLMSALFVLGGLVTLYLLFQLQSDLSLRAGVLSATESGAAQPYLFRVQLIAVATLVLGFTAVVFLSRRKSSEVVYVEKQKKITSAEEKSEQEEKAAEADSSFVDAIVQGKDTGSEKIEKIFTACCKKVEAVAGAYYGKFDEDGREVLRLIHHYALPLTENQDVSYSIGEGLVGQVAKARKTMKIDDIPDGTVKVVSGLGTASPRHLLFIPVKKGEKLLGVTEIGLFRLPKDEEIHALEQAHNKLADALEATPITKARKSAKKEENEDLVD